MTTKTWVALLRGINVGRAKRVSMAELRTLLESLGHTEVRTHLNSGNVIFSAVSGTAAKHERQIAAGIEAELGLDVKVLVRSSDELAAVVEANPFVAAGVERKELHVAFLSAQPPAKKLSDLDRGALAPDEFQVGDRAIYLRMPNGTMGSRLPDWERLLGLTVTTRNWNTATRLAALAAG